MSERFREGARSSSRASPSLLAIPSAARTCPCGSERSVANTSPAATSASPASARRSASIAAAGSFETLATVSWRTRLPSRTLRRTSQYVYTRSPCRRSILATCIAGWPRSTKAVCQPRRTIRLATDPAQDKAATPHHQTDQALSRPGNFGLEGDHLVGRQSPIGELLECTSCKYQ